MPLLTLRPNTYAAAQFNLQEEGAVILHLESDIPVKTYIVRPKGFELFEDGSKTFKYYGGFPDPRRNQEQEVWLPFSGPFTLIISNPDKNTSAHVDYKVSY
jgi:hypothetical protein